MPRKQLSREALALVAGRFKALSQTTRLRLLMTLMEGARTVSELVEETDATQANVSRHLKTLADAGFLKRSKRGSQVVYEIADESVFSLCDLMCGSAEKFLKQQVKAFR